MVSKNQNIKKYQNTNKNYKQSKKSKKKQKKKSLCLILDSTFTLLHKGNTLCRVLKTGPLQGPFNQNLSVCSTYPPLKK